MSFSSALLSFNSRAPNYVFDIMFCSEFLHFKTIFTARLQHERKETSEFANLEVQFVLHLVCWAPWRLHPSSNFSTRSKPGLQLPISHVLFVSNFHFTHHFFFFFQKFLKRKPTLRSVSSWRPSCSSSWMHMRLFFTWLSSREGKFITHHSLRWLECFNDPLHSWKIYFMGQVENVL